MHRLSPLLVLLFVSLLALPRPALAALRVVTTTQDLAAITSAVGGDLVQVDAISRGDLDPHFIDAKPSFMVKLSKADLVVSIGMDLEVGWLPSLIAGARNPKLASGGLGALDASATVSRIEVPTGSIDRSRGDLHGQGNPHYWLDPENGRAVARAVAARLGQLDPAHTADFAARLKTFEEALTAAEARWARAMEPLRGVAVIGYHSTFNYFCARYGLRVVGFVEPKPGIPPSPAHTLELGAKGAQERARVILVEPYHDPGDARPIAKASGAKVVTAPTSVGAEASIVTYIDLFDALVRALTE